MHATARSPFPGFPLTVSLAARDVCPFVPADRTRLECVSGCLWITLDNDPADVVLAAGESYTTPAGRRCVVYAFEDSELRLRAPASRPARAAAAWSPWHRGAATA